MKGNVKFFDYAKGYGFVKGDEGNDYFVHITDVEGLDGLETAYPRAAKGRNYKHTDEAKGHEGKMPHYNRR